MSTRKQRKQRKQRTQRKQRKQRTRRTRTRRSLRGGDKKNVEEHIARISAESNARRARAPVVSHIARISAESNARRAAAAAPFVSAPPALHPIAAAYNPAASMGYDFPYVAQNEAQAEYVAQNEAQAEYARRVTSTQNRPTMNQVIEESKEHETPVLKPYRSNNWKAQIAAATAAPMRATRFNSASVPPMQ